MYSIDHKKHERYGNVIEITRISSDEYITPFQATNKARSLRLSLLEGGVKGIKILIDGQVLTLSQMDSWAVKEYKSLPKCEECAKILNDDIFTHSLSDNLFCSKLCSEKNYAYLLDKMNDNEESEYDCI